MPAPDLTSGDSQIRMKPYLKTFSPCLLLLSCISSLLSSLLPSPYDHFWERKGGHYKIQSTEKIFLAVNFWRMVSLFFLCSDDRRLNIAAT